MSRGRAALQSLALALVAACSGGSGERGTGPSNPAAVGDVATARSSRETSVVVIGQAFQTKLGPVVTAGDLTTLRGCAYEIAGPR